MLRCLEDGQLEDRMIETDIPASRGVNPLDHLQGSNVQELVIRQAAGAGTCSVLPASLATIVEGTSCVNRSRESQRETRRWELLQASVR